MDLESVVFAEDCRLTSIGIEAFKGCDALTQLVLPKGLEYIGDYAFYGCDLLLGVVVSKELLANGEVGANIFYVSGVKNIYFAGTYEEWEALNMNLGMKVYFFTASPSTATGDYWYFDNDQVVFKSV